MNPIGMPPAASWNIQGGLPWNGGGSGAGAIAGSDNPYAIAGAYSQAYNSALAMNQSNYNNVLSGYQKAIASQTSAQQAIQAGYSNLYNDVLGQVKGIYSGQADEINYGSSQNLAKSSQQLIDRGLGNTTIQSSVNRGVESDRQHQLTLLAGQEAGTEAQYMSSLGLAGLQSQQRGLEDTTGFAGKQLDFMNSVNANYPNAGMYANLAQQAAANKANRANPYGMGGGSFAGAPGPKLGYVPSGGPYYPDSGANPQAGTGMGGGGSWLMDQYGGIPQAQSQSFSNAEYDVGQTAEGAGTGIASMWGDYGGGGDF